MTMLYFRHAGVMAKIQLKSELVPMKKGNTCQTSLCISMAFGVAQLEETLVLGHGLPHFLSPVCADSLKYGTNNKVT